MFYLIGELLNLCACVVFYLFISIVFYFIPGEIVHKGCPLPLSFSVSVIIGNEMYCLILCLTTC